MEIGDFAYLIFLAIIAIANAFRSRAKRKREQEEAQRQVEEFERRRDAGELVEEEEQEDPYRNVWEELFEREAEAEPVPEPEPAPTPKPAARTPVYTFGGVTTEIREGESMAAYAQRIRDEGRYRDLEPHDPAFRLDAGHRAGRGVEVDFDLRTAVLYDAILRSPYLPGVRRS